MSSLAIWTICLGALKLLFSVAGVVAPVATINGLRAFPRSRWPAIALSTVGLIWAAILLDQMPMGPFDRWKVALYVLCPLAIVLVPIYLEELLAPRALGGLFLLLGTPILNTARWHPSGLSVIISLLAYLMILFGMIFVMAPYIMGRIVRFMTEGESRFKAFSAIGVLFGSALILFGLFTF